MSREDRPLRWMPKTRESLSSFPEDVKDEIGFALRAVQKGETPHCAKQLHGMPKQVWELCSDFDKDTYRACYTVVLRDEIYVLHTFKKKSVKGGETPKPDIDLIKKRLKDAIAEDKARHEIPKQESPKQKRQRK